MVRVPTVWTLIEPASAAIVLILVATACGDEAPRESYEKAQGANAGTRESTNPPTQQPLPIAEAWHGTVAGCLKSAREQKGRTASGTPFTRLVVGVHCAPLFRGTSREEVGRLAADWASRWCPKTLSIQGASPQGYAGCALAAQGPTVVATQQISEAQAAGACGPDVKMIPARLNCE